MSDRWEDDWNAFIEYTSSLVRSGTTNEALTKLFGGHIVHWQGTLQEIDLDESLPAVTLDMKKITVDLGSHRTATVDVLSLPMAENAISGWCAARPGDHVLFEARLGSEPAIFPAIEVETVESGQTIMMISVRNGKLLHILEYGPADHTVPLAKPASRPVDPLAKLRDFKYCWDGSEPGWMVRPYPVVLCKFTVEFDGILGPTDEQIEFLRTISEPLGRESIESIREMIGDQTQFDVPGIRDWTDEELDRITEQLDEHGLGGEGSVDRRWSRLIPVDPDGKELIVDNRSLESEITKRMVNAGVPIEGGKKVVEWSWYLGRYARLE